MPKSARINDSTYSLLKNEQSSSQANFFLSNSDIGVRRNKGRPGTKYAPDAIMNTFFKMGKKELKNYLIKTTSISSQDCEKQNFSLAQDKESQKILQSLNLQDKNIFIGGGHDHIFPLLKAIQEKTRTEIYIINIDAHLDTRVEDISHSGTPFRDFDKIVKNKVKLIQYGIHAFANSESTMSPLINIEQSILKKGDKSFYKFLGDIPKTSFIVLSLDADAINSSQMQAVSAVNFDGVSLEEVNKVIEIVKTYQNSLFGIYEYNPLYDDLSQKGARNLCSLIYNYLV